MKNRFLAIIFALLLGSFGIHKFYLGNILSGVMYLVFSWTGIPFVLSLVDVIILATMPDRQFDAIHNHRHYNLPLTVNSVVDVPVVGTERLDVAIIRTCASKDMGATVTECIVATGEDPLKVKETIENLCRKGFLMPDNRAGDYAVVYRSV